MIALGLARFVLLALLVLFVAYVTWLLRRHVDS
jgi:cbb3-type cytochrome oxidase subunit 3